MVNIWITSIELFQVIYNNNKRFCSLKKKGFCKFLHILVFLKGDWTLLLRAVYSTDFWKSVCFGHRILCGNNCMGELFFSVKHRQRHHSECAPCHRAFFLWLIHHRFKFTSAGWKLRKSATTTNLKWWRKQITSHKSMLFVSVCNDNYCE